MHPGHALLFLQIYWLILSRLVWSVSVGFGCFLGVLYAQDQERGTLGQGPP